MKDGLLLKRNPKIAFILPKKQINLLLKNFSWQNSVTCLLLKIEIFLMDFISTQNNLKIMEFYFSKIGFIKSNV